MAAVFRLKNDIVLIK